MNGLEDINDEMNDHAFTSSKKRIDESCQKDLDLRLWPIEAAQKRAKRSLVSIAQEFAATGRNLRDMAEHLQVGYSSLKCALERRNWHHPRATELIENKIAHETGMSLADYMKQRTSQGACRQLIAEECAVDPATLQRFGDRYGIQFPKTCRTRDYTNIIAAIRRRTKDRNDLVLIDYDGKQWYLQELVDHHKINRSTYLRRRELGWSIRDALLTPVYGRAPRASKNARIAPSATHPWRIAEQRFHQEYAARQQGKQIKESE